MKLARSLVRVGGLAAVLAVVGVLVWGVLHSPFLEIKTIEVRGPVEASGLQEVTRTVEEALSGNIFTADIGAVKRAVEGITWIKSAYVSRLWPDSLYIEVKRHQSVAIWEDGRLVSEDGVLYVSNDEPIERLLQLPALSGDPQYAEQAVRYLPRFNEEARRIDARVKAVKVTFRGSWSVVLESTRFDSMEIELGRALTQGGPINRLRQVLDSMDRVVAMLKAYPERIDARYKNAFAAQLPPQAYAAAQSEPAGKSTKNRSRSSKARGQ